MPRSFEDLLQLNQAYSTTRSDDPRAYRLRLLHVLGQSFLSLRGEGVIRNDLKGIHGILTESKQGRFVLDLPQCLYKRLTRLGPDTAGEGYHHLRNIPHEYLSLGLKLSVKLPCLRL